MTSQENIGTSMPPKSMKELLWEARDNVIAKRKALLVIVEDKIALKDTIKDLEAVHIMDGLYTSSGKNEKEREATLRMQFPTYRDDLSEIEVAERSAIHQLECALDARRCLESILKIDEAS